MEIEPLIEHVVWRGALAGDRERAERVLFAALESLAPHLDPADARDLARELPGELADVVRAAARGAPGDVVEKVEAAEHTTAGFALEHAEAACEAIARELAPDLLRRIRLHLPERFARWFRERAPEESPPPHPKHPPVAPGDGTTLSSGQPGSRHPVSAAGDLAHRHSVARSDDPHGDRKLSSARGRRS